jgi:glyoxylase-like metal-dependent hydrolase (beta-lactamase superfamily II)
MLPRLKQFRQEGCLSYLVYDSSAGGGLLVDPRADLLEDYRQFMAEHRIRLELVVDTRLHWHHLSGTHLIAEAFAVPVAMSSRTESKRVTRKLFPGEKLTFETFSFDVLETPGVSPDAICLYGEGLLLSGDTIVAGAPARTDLPGADPTALWSSMDNVLRSLPGDTIVLPGYDVQELIFSTIAIEKSRGPDWQCSSLPAFIRTKADEKPPRGDGEAKYRLDYNLEAYPVATAESHFGGVGPAQVYESRGVAAISVEGGHMPGTRNIPLSELALHWSELTSYKRVYVSCQSGRRSQLAASTLGYLGLRDVVNVTGGLRAWENAGFSVES